MKHEGLLCNLSVLLQDFWPKFCSGQQDEAIYKELSAQAKQMAHPDETGAAVVELLQQLLAVAACNDPTAVLLSEVMLPVCRERLEAAAGIRVSISAFPLRLSQRQYLSSTCFLSSCYIIMIATLIHV